MQSEVNPKPACSNQNDSVQSKGMDRGSPDRRTADDALAIATPSKVFLPLLCARIEGRHFAERFRIDNRDSRLLEGVAPKAAKTEVFQRVAAAAPVRTDVIDGEVVTGKILG